MKQVELYVPQLADLWFYQKMISDPQTMSYNANYDIPASNYHRDTGCIDYSEADIRSWFSQWIGQEPKRFFAYIQRCCDRVWLGEVNFQYVPHKEWWDMGIVLYAPYRQQGYASAAINLLLEHAFCRCGVTRIHNYFENTRKAAWHLHRKAGFREMSSDGRISHLLLTKTDYLHMRQSA